MMFHITLATGVSIEKKKDSVIRWCMNGSYCGELFLRLKIIKIVPF